MRKTLSEIKQLSNTKVKKSKPKVIHPTKYITSVLIASDQIIKEVDKFQKFCFEELDLVLNYVYKYVQN